MTTNISVAMCTYNGEKFLSEQIESIIQQSTVPKELVICDDNSTDNTRDILSEYSDSYPDLITLEFNEENLGVTKNFEKCMGLCEGHYIALSDHDDIWDPRKLEYQLKAIEDNDAKLVFHNSSLVKEDMSYITDNWSVQQYDFRDARNGRRAFELILSNSFVQGSTILFESSLLDTILPIPSNWYHDRYIVILSSIMGPLFDINIELSNYRQHENQEIGIKSGAWNKIKNIVETGGEYYASYRCRWDVLYDQISKLDEGNLSLEKQWVLEMVNGRSLLDQRRSEIYKKGSPLGTKLEYIWHNYNENLYRKYNQGYKGMAQDILFALLTRGVLRG